MTCMILKPTIPPADVRESLLAPLAGRTYVIEVSARQTGILAGSSRLLEKAAKLRLGVEWVAQEGCRLDAGARVCRMNADALQATRAEDHLLGVIGKVSGVATAAARFVALAQGRARIVCGAWKKVAPEIRQDLREAIRIGGAGIRLVDEPFLYLDKNQVRLFGGVAAAVRAGRQFPNRSVVVQLRGEGRPLIQEADEAVREGADILMVDTGNLEDLVALKGAVAAGKISGDIPIAFGGGVHTGNLQDAIAAGADIIDIGRAIIDAPLLDFRLDVLT